jgi:cytochrome c oxidase subunit 2
MPTAVRKLILSTVAACGLALTLSGAALAEPSPLEPADPAGPNAAAIADIYWVVFGVTLGLLVLVVAGLGLAIARSSDRAVVATDADEPAPTPARRIAFFALIPAVALAVVAIAVFVKLSDAKDAPAAGDAGTVAVEVVAAQDGFTYTYANGASATDRLRVPVGAVVVLTLTSDDVQHSWWVPQLAGQARIFPGETRTLSFRADRTGIFPGRSTVPSGPSFDLLETAVEALPAADYEDWVEQAASEKEGS